MASAAKVNGWQMASAAKVEETTPDTLPEDFSDWDSGEPPATLPDDFTDFDDLPAIVAPPSGPASAPASARISALPIAPVKPAKARAIMPNVVGGLPARSRMIATAPAVSRETFELPQPARAEFEPTLEVTVEPKKNHKTRMFYVMGAVPVLTLVILIPWKFYKSESQPTAVVVSQSEVPDPSTTTITMPTPRLNKPSPTQKEPNAVTVKDDTPVVQSEMMNNQLNAPSRISRDIKLPAQDAPPVAAFGATGMDGLGASGSSPIGSVFGKQTGPKVQSENPKTLTVSAGVAQGMLIQRTNPTYPAIAKSARVAGTVVLQATISKTGTIQGLRAVSGPAMLRQSAMDAVRTWRYRPYKLDNQPVEVDTTVMVVFNLGS